MKSSFKLLYVLFAGSCTVKQRCISFYKMGYNYIDSCHVPMGVGWKCRTSPATILSDSPLVSFIHRTYIKHSDCTHYIPDLFINITMKTQLNNSFKIYLLFIFTFGTRLARRFYHFTDKLIFRAMGSLWSAVAKDRWRSFGFNIIIFSKCCFKYCPVFVAIWDICSDSNWRLGKNLALNNGASERVTTVFQRHCLKISTLLTWDVLWGDESVKYFPMVCASFTTPE